MRCVSTSQNNGDMTEFQDGPGNDGSGLDGSSTDRIIEGFARINEKVDAMRNQRLNDTDSLGDKAVNFALPSIAGFVAGKLFTLVWNKFVARKRPSDGTGELGDGVVDQQESLFMSILFAALSAAVGAAVSQLSDRGSKALVARRHRRHYRRVPHQRKWVALGASLCDNDSMVTNSTIETLLNRRSIRKFVAEPFDDDTVATLETVAQHAASSQYLNDWSAVRVKDPALKKRMSEIGRQPYIAEAPLLYVFVADEHRNAIIAESKGVSTDSDTYGLAGSYRFSQAQNDAVLALHAMETAAYSLGLGCVILGSLLNDVPGLIEALHLPQYTYPVLGLAIGKPDQAPALKPRMPRELQFFDDVYPSDDDAIESIKERIGAFDVSVHEYYDLRNTDRPVDAFSDQIASIAAQRMDATHQVIPNATSQGFRLDR